MGSVKYTITVPEEVDELVKTEIMRAHGRMMKGELSRIIKEALMARYEHGVPGITPEDQARIVQEWDQGLLQVHESLNPMQRLAVSLDLVKQYAALMMKNMPPTMKKYPLADTIALLTRTGRV